VSSILIEGDAKVAAANFNWLVMSNRLNRVMFQGNTRPRRARSGTSEKPVRLFVAACWKK
jgi:hypothetical protein